MTWRIRYETKIDEKNYLLNKFNTGEKVHSEINESPVDTLLLVFLLFQDEHVMVEELLQLLISEVDAKLFETVVLWGKEHAIVIHKGEVRVKKYLLTDPFFQSTEKYKKIYV